MDFWPWFWFVYFSVALMLSFKWAFQRWSAGGWWKKCELAFSLLYFGANWLLYAFAVFIGFPPL